MKVKITEISEKDAHYEHRDDLIGCVGDAFLIDTRDEEGFEEWSFIHLENCQYPKLTVYCPENGDDTVFGYAKYEIIEE